MSLIENHPVDTEAGAVARLATQAVEPQPLTDDVVALADGGGKVRVVDLEEYRDHPRRATATRLVYDAASFAAYLDRHEEGACEVYADQKAAEITAILDSHRTFQAGWQGHRITLKLTTSPAWDAWRALDGKLLPQTEFAEHIELQASDVRDPAPADLLDLAQTFEATKSVDYESSERLADGQVRLRYVEKVEAKAGQRGDLTIPTVIKLAVRPYIGAPLYSVTARFRYRIGSDRSLKLGYVLERPQLILDLAFEDIVALLRTGRGETSAEREVIPVRAPIYLGRP